MKRDVPEDEAPKPVNILTLDGGGVRGLSSLLVLRALMDRLKLANGGTAVQPYDIFHLICGTSTGGLIALMLGRLRMSVDEAIKSYRDISKRVFKDKATGQREEEGFTPMYDASILETCVKELVAKNNPNCDHSAPLEDPLKDDQGLCRTFVVAVPQSAGDLQPKRFRSYAMDAEPADTCAIWEAARATTAMRPFFPPIKICDTSVIYIDGAFSGANNPSKLAIDEALDIFQGRPIGCLLSLGTGVPDAVKVTGDQAKISEAYGNLLTSCENIHEAVGRVRLRNKEPYFRFSVDRSLGKIAFDEWDREEELTAITHAYMRGYEEDDMAKTCIKALKQQATEVNAKYELENML